MSDCKLLELLVPSVGVEPTRPYGQRILSHISRTKPSLTNYNKPIFTGIVSRQSQLHSGRFKRESRHFHVIRATDSYPLSTFLGLSVLDVRGQMSELLDKESPSMS